MNALSPQARTLVDQTVQSVSLNQKHRAQIWSQLQQRVLAESSRRSPHQSSDPGVARLALRRRIGLAGSIAACCVTLAGVFGTAHRSDHAAREPRLEVHSPAPRESRETTLAIAQADVSAPAPLPATDPSSKQAPTSGLQPKRRSVPPGGKGTAPRDRPRPSQSASNKVATLLPPRELLGVVGQPSKGLVRKVPYGPSSTTRKEASPEYDAPDDLTAAALRRSGARFGASPGWLELAPRMAGGIAPLGENWFESSLPLKLTQPQLRLETTSFE